MNRPPPCRPRPRAGLAEHRAFVHPAHAAVTERRVGAHGAGSDDPASTDAQPAASTLQVAADAGKASKDDAQSLQFTPFKEGFGFRTKDGSSSLKIRGVVQADNRAYVQGGTNTFLLRRVRPTFDGTVYNFFDFRMTADLVTNPALLDAYGNVRLIKELQLRVGRFKSPVGLERLQNDPDIPFVERGLPTNFVPDRDTGAQLHGDIANGTVSSRFGYFNGAPDTGSIDADVNDKKDVVGAFSCDRSRPPPCRPAQEFRPWLCRFTGNANRRVAALCGPRPNHVV